MKKLTAIAILILLIIGTVISQPGCNTEPDVTPSESNRWLELLGVLPSNDNTLRATYLQDSAYLEERMQQYPQISGEYTIILDIPLLTGSNPLVYTDEEWKQTLGFVADDVDQSIYAGTLPMSYYEAVGGRFSREDIDNAVRTGPMNEMLETVSYQGREFYSWGSDSDINPSMSSNVRPLGRGFRLALVDDFVFWVRWTDGMKEMIDSYDGNIVSLADSEDYKLLAGALEELATVTAFFSSESQSQSHISDVYGDILAEPSNEGQRLFAEEIERQLQLEPYLSFATGAGIDAEGYYLVIVLLNSSEEVARENATLLEQRINQSKIVWDSQSGVIWSDLIESMEIESQDQLTVAKLYGEVARYWANFDLTGMMTAYEPLLIHK